MSTNNLTDQQKSHVEYFDNVYQKRNTEVDFEHYSQERFGPWSPYWYVYDYVRSYYRNPEQRLLSYGCGVGKDALRYAKMGYDCRGFDISSVAVQRATESARRHELQSRCQFSVQSAEKLDYPSEYFDIVVGVDILHHIDVQQAVPEIHRVLKPGGAAIFREPLATKLRDKFRNSPLVTWFIPKGTKSFRSKLTYTDKEGEHKLDKTDFQILSENFSSLTIQRWRVMALLSVFIDNRPFLERCDWALFKLFPFLRHLGDQSVITVIKNK